MGKESQVRYKGYEIGVKLLDAKTGSTIKIYAVVKSQNRLQDHLYRNEKEFVHLSVSDIEAKADEEARKLIEHCKLFIDRRERDSNAVTLAERGIVLAAMEEDRPG